MSHRHMYSHMHACVLMYTMGWGLGQTSSSIFFQLSPTSLFELPRHNAPMQTQQAKCTREPKSQDAYLQHKECVMVCPTTCTFL